MIRTLDQSSHFISGRFNGGQIDILSFACDPEEAETLLEEYSRDGRFSDLHIGETESAGYSWEYDSNGTYHRLEKMSRELEVSDQSMGFVYDRFSNEGFRYRKPWQFSREFNFAEFPGWPYGE